MHLFWLTTRKDGDKAKVFDEVFFWGGHLKDKWFDEISLNAAVSMFNAALNESKNNLEQISINDICYDVNKRETMNELIWLLQSVGLMVTR